MTLGIAFFDAPSFIIGILIDKFGCRFVRLISVIFHIIGWLALALLQQGRDYLLYIHCIFSSISGIVTVITAYTSSNYFSSYRALVASLLAGSGISSTMWFSIYKVLIENKLIELKTLSFIWLSVGLMICLSSFYFFDWKFSIFKLPYQFDVKFETNSSHEIQEETFWTSLRSPFYILIVLFLSFVLLPTVFLSVYWQTFINYSTKQNISLVTKYTFAYNVSTLSSILICPLNGYLLGYKSHKSRKQKLLNISIAETLSWLFNIILTILLMTSSSNLVVVIIILNNICRSTIVGGCQALLSTCFPSKSIGRLTGIMWTVVGLISFIQLYLIQLTDDIQKAWRAWLIILILVLLMSIHLIQIYKKYYREKKPEIVTHRF